ncbi:MAG: 50S ribosomal protein L16 [Candidatus Micrarchaeota archaeon]|nr:50S ribosomal protein L16 [Candidatus Micrarchaeota archaeon]
MGLRPARTCRGMGKTPWTRYSKKKPRKSYVKALPHLSLLVYEMGNRNQQFDYTCDLVAEEDVQLRDNSLEAARQAANKYLEKTIPNQYFFKVRVYPHNVLRENKMIAGAGADRLQKGMRKAYGRPTDRAARIKAGQAVFTMHVSKENLPHVEEAYRRARRKMSGKFKMVQLDYKPNT